MLTIELIDAIASENPKISETIRSTTINAFDELELATVLPERLHLCVRDLRRNLDITIEGYWTIRTYSDRWGSYVWLGELQAAIDATSEQKWLEIAEVLWQRFWERRKQPETGGTVDNEVLRKIDEIPELIVKQRYTDTKWVWQYRCTASDEDFQTEDWDGTFNNPLDAVTHFLKTILEENNHQYCYCYQ